MWRRVVQITILVVCSVQLVGCLTIYHAASIEYIDKEEMSKEILIGSEVVNSYPVYKVDSLKLFMSGLNFEISQKKEIQDTFEQTFIINRYANCRAGDFMFAKDTPFLLGSIIAAIMIAEIFAYGLGLLDIPILLSSHSECNKSKQVGTKTKTVTRTRTEWGQADTGTVVEIEIHGKRFSQEVRDGKVSFSFKEILAHCEDEVLRDKEFLLRVVKPVEYEKGITFQEDEIYQIVADNRGIPFETGRPEKKPFIIPSAMATVDKEKGMVKIECEMENEGEGGAYRVIGKLESEHPAFNGWVMVFGTVKAKEKMKHHIMIKIPPGLPPGKIPVEINFTEYNNTKIDPTRIEIEIK